MKTLCTITKISAVVSATFLSALTAPAFADDGFRFVDGEAVWAYRGPSTSNNASDSRQRQNAESNRPAMIADGFRYVGGEAGWIYECPPVRREPFNLAANPPIGNLR